MRSWKTNKRQFVIIDSDSKTGSIVALQDHGTCNLLPQDPPFNYQYEDFRIYLSNPANLDRSYAIIVLSGAKSSFQSYIISRDWQLTKR